MPTSQDVHEIKHPLQDSIEEIRTLCRLHALPAGQWKDLTDLPFRIAQDASLRNDIAEVVRSLQRRNLNLPDVLDALVVAVGGPAAPAHTRELNDQLNLLGGFLSNVGHWPGTESLPILAPGEVPDNIQKFTRPQPAAPRVHVFEAAPPEASAPIASASQPRASGQPTTAEEPVSLPDKFPDDSSVPRPDSTLPIADIVRALGRLERGNLELRAHLDSIDQRISRMEPLIESGAQTSAHASAPTTARTSTPAPRAAGPSLSPPSSSPTFTHRDFSRREPLRTQPIHTGPIHTPQLETEPIRPDPTQPESLRAEPFRSAPVLPEALRSGVSTPPAPVLPRPQPRGNGSATPSERSLRPIHVAAEVPAPAPEELAPAAPVHPRFSRYSRNPDFSETEPSSAPPHQVSDPSNAGPRPVQLPRGFFGTAPDQEASFLPDSAVDISAGQPLLRRRRRNVTLAITVLLLLILLAAAGYLYRRSILGETDSSASGNSTATTTSPSSGAISSQGPLTSAPSRPSGADATKLPGTRIASQPRPSADEPSPGGFRPAGTFVPSAIMDGHLLSAPIPDGSRVPATAGLKGIVVMEVNISSTGVVEDISVLGGSTALRSAAIEAVRNWRYKPYLLNGNAVEVRTIVRVDFNERKSQPAERSAPFPQ